MHLIHSQYCIRFWSKVEDILNRELLNAQSCITYLVSSIKVCRTRMYLILNQIIATIIRVKFLIEIQTKISILFYNERFDVIIQSMYFE